MTHHDIKKVKTMSNRVRLAKKRMKKKDNKYNSAYLMLIPVVIIAVMFLASCTSPGDGTNTIAKYSYIGVNKVCSESTNVERYNPIIGYFKTLADIPFPVPYVMFQQHEQDGTLGSINTEGFC